MQIRWFCWDGLWTWSALASGKSGARLLASHQLTSAQIQGAPGKVPTPGTERCVFFDLFISIELY